MPTRADPRPPSSGRSRPVLNSTAQGGPLYWARKAARICGEGMVFGPRCQPRPSPATPGVHTYGGCSPWHRLVWAVARERGPVATAREREPVAQHGANARASGSLGANAPGLWPMRYVNTYPWHMAHGAWRMAHGTSHVWVKTAGRLNESTARSWCVPKKGENPPRSGRRSVLQSGRPFPCGLSHQAEQAHDGAWRMAHGTWHMAHSAWRMAHDA